MRGDPRDEELKLLLRDLPREHGNRYSQEAGRKLLQILFYNLSDGNPSLLHYFFPDGPPPETTESKPWRLAEAQGAVDGAEYSEAARGKPCGHIFRDGEATYQCMTCSNDATCVLCARCFEASEHEGHQIVVVHSSGKNGCCDCGDPEAWVLPLNCSIHSTLPGDTPEPEEESPSGHIVPERLRHSIRVTIGCALDYICDVFSCSPEQMRTPKNEDAIRQNEVNSRLSSWYGVTNEPENDNEFALILWNDEKHTLEEVQEQVARACRIPRSQAIYKAREVDAVGRSVVAYSRNVADLISKACILAQIKVTVTIRSARDTFREQMCETIIEWLSDIAPCSVGKDRHLFMQIICEELLNKWRIGSTAFNLSIAQGGLIDNQKLDDRLTRLRAENVHNRVMRFRQAAQRNTPLRDATGEELQDGTSSDDDNDDDDDVEDDDDAEEIDGDDEMEIDQAFLVIPGEIATIEDPDREDGNVMMAIRAQARPDTPDVLSEDYEGMDAGSAAQTDANTLIGYIPRTPKQKTAERPQAPGYWLVSPVSSTDQPNPEAVPLWENMHERVRVDHLVFYDMRMWKNLRDTLRQFYIATVVTVPSFKRILSLRFAALYTHLSQLYLLADREADHSVIHLSLQMLTSPSITEEVVKRSNFYTRLLAILYTFLTKRQVGEPEDVDALAAISFEQNTVPNRRIYHVFNDVKYLLESKFVQECVRTKPEYLMQYLDFAKLFQGICPNRRAVGQHVEYESEAWMSASILIRDITRITRQVCECFRWSSDQDPGHICRAIRQTAKATIINSLGVELERFKEGELVKPLTFKTMPAFRYEELLSDDKLSRHVVVDCAVEKSPMSFHHALHYTLSWLINSGKSMSRDQLESLLKYSHHQLQSQEVRSGSKARIPELTPQHYLLALFDIPLRLCAWMAQVRTGMWVRNGITLRHQLSTYRGVPQRDVSYQRDIFMLQTAFVVCPPATFLASVIDRFGMTEWMTGNFVINAGYEDTQMLDVAEEFLHLLIVILCDRTLLQPQEDEPHNKAAIILRDLVHVLCFKPLTFSKLAERLSEKAVDSKEFLQVLEKAATFRPPEGLADSGTWRLKDDFYLQLDPYYTYYNKSQREEAETLYRTHKSKLLGEPLDQVFFEPQLQPIRSGIFQNLTDFTQTPLFSQIIHCFLRHVNEADIFTQNITPERVEAFLHVVLHLMLIAVFEDRSLSVPTSINPRTSFVTCIFETEVATREPEPLTILSQLFTILQNEKLQSTRPRVRFLLMHIRQAQPETFDKLFETGDLRKVRSILMNSTGPDTSADQSLKKKQAQARQARVMASFKKQQDEFIESQNIDWGVESLSESDEDMDFMDQTLETKFWEIPNGTCILCQAETSEKQLYGTLAYFTESHLFRHTDLNDQDFVKEVFATPRDLDRSANAIRPFGVAGDNTEWISKVVSDGTQIEYERKGLGKGFPRRFVGSGPMMTGCGHIMHLSCFYEYISATERRHSFQYTRNHPERPSHKEFICPLCKALGNAFMPVIWKPRACVKPFAPEEGAFDTWLAYVGHQSASSNILSPDMFRSYAAQNLVPSFLSERTYVVNQEQIARATAAAPDRRPLIAKTSSSAELGQAYKRLRDTLSKNELPTRFGQDSSAPDYFSMTDTLAETIGFSIAAIEIAARGSESQTPTFVDSVPNQSIAQLRVLSETVTAYLTMGALHTKDRTLDEIRKCSRSQYEILLPPSKNESRSSSAHIHASLLSKDSFVFAAACSVYLVPVFDIPIHHVLRLCYLAEIIKIVIAVLRDPNVVQHISTTKSVESLPSSPQQGQNFSSFVQSIIYQYQNTTLDNAKIGPVTVDENPNNRYAFDQHIRLMISSYAVPFLRKCALLMHIRYGVDYSTLDSSVDRQSSELDRLSCALKLPSVDDLIVSYVSGGSTGDALRHLGASWISDWQSLYCYTNAAIESSIKLSQSTISLQMRDSISMKISHPGIYELVALPQIHDTLSSTVISHRCPTTERELNDPCICLFCGDIFCGQATCCSRISVSGDQERVEGGCYQHQKICGGNIGMFLNIRKCAVLFLNGENGSWFTSPYLDKHGEVDMGLKRRQQLFLHQKRYDRLFRDVWLGFGGGVPSAVARKLEAEINAGGWETI